MSIGFRARGGRRRRSGAGSGARIALVALGLLCLGAAAATAQVLIDDFSTAQAGTSLQDPPDLPGATQGATQGGAGMIGGQRDLFLTWIAGGIGPVSTSVTGGSLLFSTTADSDASVLVTWDGDTDPANLDPSGLGGADLTAGGASALQLSVDSSDAGIELILTVFTNAADFSTSAQVLPAVAGSTDFFFPFSSFVADPGGSGADFTAVGAVTLLVQGSGTNTGSALSFSADFIDTVTPAISALQVDQPGTPAAPGDTITFEATIENTGGQGTGVTFEETLDTNVTIVPGSVKTSPLARNDSFSGIGNVGLTVAAPGLLANDVDLDDAGPSSLVVTTIGAVPTAQGGTATLAADGSFTYAPPAGFQGVDGFSYSVVDDEAETDSASAVITLDAIVWFVENDACTPHPCGSGTFADPFSSLKQAEAVSAAGHIIRLREGDGTTTNNDQGLIKQDGQLLIGSGVDLVVNGQTIETATTRPAMTHVAGNGIDLASENTIRGLDIAGASGAALFGTGVGTVTVTEVDVTDSGGAALDIDGGTLAMTFGTLDSLSSSGHGIHLRNVGGSLSATTTNLEDPTDTGIRIATSAGASFDFGTTTITNAGDAGGADAGIDLATSGPATFTFSSLSSTTENGSGLVANGSGTVSIGGTTNTITATGGPALDVTNTDLGTGWTFSSLTSNTSPTEGIRLDTIGDPLTVTTSTMITDADTTGILVQNSSGATAYDFGPTTIIDSAVGAGANANGIDLATGNSGASFTFDSLSVTTDAGFGLRSGDSTLVVGGGTNTLTATGGAAIDLTNTAISGTATFASLSSVSSPATGVNLDGVTGNLAVTAGSITGATGNAFDVAAGSGNVTYGGSITNTAARSIEITGRTGDAVLLAGNINDTGTGINVSGNSGGSTTLSGATKVVSTGGGNAVTLASNSGHTLAFTGGGLDIDTTSGTGFNATGGATAINVTGSGNTITSTTGTALNVDSSTIGASGMTFGSISSDGGSNPGIILSNTGSSGGLAVTGDGTTGGVLDGSNNGSGGIIVNKTTDAIQLTNTQDVSLRQMNIGQAGALGNIDGNGVRAIGVNGLTIANSSFRNVADQNTPDEAAVFISSPAVASNITLANNLFQRSFDDHVRFENGDPATAAGAAAIGTVVVTENRFDDNDASGSGNDAFLYRGDNGSNATLTVTSNSFFNSDGDHLQVALNGTASANVTIGGAPAAGNTMTANHGTVLGSGITLSSGQGAAATNFSGTLTYLIQNNNIQDASAGAINVNLSTSSVAGQRYSGTIANNTIGATSDPGSGGFGIQLTTNGAGTSTATVQNNSVRSWDGPNAITLTARDGSNRLNATVRDNVFREPTVSASTEAAVEVASGAVGTDTTVICLDITDAAVDGNGNNDFDETPNPSFGDMFFGTLHGGSVLVAGYGGAANDGPALEAFVQGGNVGTPTVALFAFGGTVSGAAANACQ